MSEKDETDSNDSTADESLKKTVRSDRSINQDSPGGSDFALSSAAAARLDAALARTIAHIGTMDERDPSETIRAVSTSPEDSFFWADEGQREEPTPEHAPTLLISEFKMLEVIGKGGMGVVFRALQPNLDREVAVKTMRNEIRNSPELKDAFVSEAIVTARLDHPNIVPVHSMATSKEGLVSFSMKLVRGTPWSKLIHPQDPAIEETTLARHLEILKAVSFAIDFAHFKGILHRDLKPENVMVGSFGEVLVMDWGLACRFGEQSDADSDSPTRRSEHAADIDHISGTPAYLAPEMAMGMGPDFGPWTDVYLLGGILHEVLLGRPPHQGPSVQAIVTTAAAARPPTFPDSVPRGLQNICRQALATLPADRYQSVAEFIEAIAEYENHHESEELATLARANVKRASQQKRGKRAYGFYNQAIAGYRQALEIWPENTEARDDLMHVHRAMVEIAIERGDLGIAQINVEEIPDNQDLLGRIGRISDERGSEKKAAKLQRIVISLTLTVVIASLLIGFILVSIAQHKAEEEKLEKQQALDDFERMSDIKHLADARREATTLWPPNKALMPKLQKWIEKNTPLFDRLSIHQATLTKIRSRADSYSEEDRALDFAMEMAEIGRLKERRKILAAKNPPVGLGQIDQRIADLEAITAGRRNWSFGDDIDKAFMHDSLSRLVDELRSELGRTGLLESIVKRLDLSRRIEGATILRHAKAWQETIDGIKTSPKYENTTLSPTVGLIPLGPNPTSGFYEFLHWLSHGPEAAIPVRNNDGEYDVKAETGIILVLLPGGKFHMGSIAPKNAAPTTVNVDIDAAKDEAPVHEVSLSSYFMGKYEVTQAQWQRVFPNNPSFHSAGNKTMGVLISATHPVEQVDWHAANDFAKRMGLTLPTEAQWEFACRAGTDSPFSTGESLTPEAANIADEGSQRLYTSGWRFEEGFNDGYPVHAPVGSMAANAFGIFDLHGNVFEWCQDWYGPYSMLNHDSGTGLHHPLQRKARVRRGGSFNDVAVYARSANRYRYIPEYRFDHLGFRVALTVP